MATQVTKWQDKTGELWDTEALAIRGDFKKDIFDALPAAMPGPNKTAFAEALVDNFTDIKGVVKQYKGNL